MTAGAMGEVGVEISAKRPRLRTTATEQEFGVVTTMGRSDACPVLPGKQYGDWTLDDPAGQGTEAVRTIRGDVGASRLSSLGRSNPSAAATERSRLEFRRNAELAAFLHGPESAPPSDLHD